MQIRKLNPNEQPPYAFRITGIDRDFFIRHYDEEIFENGIQVIDMIRLSQDL